MKKNGLFRLFFIILTPLLVGLFLQLKPQPIQGEDLWREVKSAQKKEDYRALLDAYQGLQQLMPWRKSETIEIARASFHAGEWQGAVEAYQQAVGEDKNRQDMYQLAEAFWQLEAFEAAQKTWGEIRSLPDNQMEDYRQLAAVQQQHQVWYGAYETLLTWQTKFPEDQRLSYELGLSQILYAPRDAHASLSRSLAVHQDRNDKVHNLQAGLPALIEEENWVMRLMYAGNLLSQQNEWAYAAAAYEAVINRVPAYAEAWALYSNVLYYLGKDGQEALHTAQKLDENAPLVLAISAYDLRRNGAYQESIGIWTRLAEREPQNALWVYEKGITQALAGELESALAAYQAAAEINQNDPFYWRELARFCLHYSVGVDSIGLAAARRALSLDPESSENNDLIGWTFFTLGDMTSAERFFLKAQLQAPYSSVVYLHLGQLYIQQDKLALAEENLVKSIQYAQNPNIQEQAERLLLDFVKK